MGSPREFQQPPAGRIALGRELFTTLIEAEVFCEQYRWFYNEERPHSALNYKTPAA